MRRQLSAEVASSLRQAIMAGELSPGEPVRAEAVGDAMGVSATPVREALQALRVEGFLELVPSKGFTVAPLTPADIRDIFAGHALLAGELTARAVSHATAADADRLQKLHDELAHAAAVGDRALLEQRNHDFHRAVYQLAGSERLRWAIRAFVKYVPRAFSAEIEGWPDTMVNDHSAIVEALIAGDAEGARAAMATHIRNSGEKLAEHLEATRDRSVTHAR